MMGNEREEIEQLKTLLEKFRAENYILKNKLAEKEISKGLPSSEPQPNLEKLFELPLHIVLLADPDGTIRNTNNAWEEILGYKRDEINNKNFLDFIHPEDIERTKNEMSRLKSGQTTFYFENRYKTKDGKFKWFLWSSIFVEEDKLYYAIAHDISKRKEAEREISIREKSLSGILEHPVNYVVYQLYRETPDSPLEVLNVSPSAEFILGLNRQEIRDYKSWLSVVHPDDYQLLQVADEKASKPPFKFEIKLRIFHKKKSMRWMHIKARGVPFENNSEKIQYVNGIIQDITEEAENQRKLKEREQILSSFSSEAPGVFYRFIVDNEGKRSFSFISENVKTLFGFNQNDFLDDADIYINSILPEDRDKFEEDLAYSYKNMTYFSSEHRVRTPDDKIKWVSANAIPEKMEDGSVQWTGIGMDVTEKKNIEEALKESESTLMAIFNHAPALMMLLNEKTEIIALNETGLNFTSKIRDDVLGKRGGNLVNCIGTLNNPLGCGNGELCKTCKVRNTVLKTLKTGAPQTKVEAEVKTFDENGEIHELTVLVSSDIVYKNNKKNVLVTIDDITEDKKIQNELKLYREQLEKLVEEKTITLNKTNQLLTEEIKKQKEAEQKVKEALLVEKELNRLKTEFVSMVSHEFRTPLTSILASADLLEFKEIIKNDENILKHIHKIQHSVENMTSMLNDVLAISRAEKGRLVYNPVKKDILELFHEIIDEEKVRHGAKHSILVTNLLENNEQFIDPNLVRQILSNLVSNAIKFSPEHENIFVNLSKVSGAIEIIVKDKGTGIKESEMESILEPFVRGGNAENIQGNGLGMTIISNAVTAHQGTIKIKSTPDVGTTIVVRLPVKSKEANP